MTDRFATIDEYISSFPDEVQKVLERIRRIIRQVVPEGEETISYHIPTVKFNGRYLVYFAGHKSHVALYPVPKADEPFDQEMRDYRSGKGTLRFPLNKPIPYDLIERVVRLLLSQRSKA